MKRLSDEDGATGDLLRKLADPPPLGAARAQRLLVEIRERVAAPPPRRWWPLALPAAAALGLAVLALLLRPSAPPQPPRVLVLAGRAETRNDSVRLPDGRVLVQTAGSPAAVMVAPGRVMVRPASVVEVEVKDWLVRVAAYRGTARIDWQDFELDAGRAWSSDGNAGPVEVRDADEIGRLLREGPSSPPIAAPPPRIAAPPPPTAAPPPIVAPPPPAKVKAKVEVPARPPVSDEPTPKHEEVPDEPRHAAPPPSALTLEATSLERAVRALRLDGDPAAALRAIDDHLTAHPHGILVREAQLTRVEALLKLGRRGEALDSLDRVSLSGLPRSREFAVIRGELRAERRRCAAAVADFALAIDGSDALAERALVGRADCRAQNSDEAGARADLRRYLERFPDGRFADKARTVSFPAPLPTKE